jgi:phage gp29-like protein
MPKATQVKLQKPNTGEIGESTMMTVGGVIQNSEYNLALKGAKGIKVYDEMRLGDATVKASMSAIKLPILSARWRIQPASEDPRDVEIAEAVESELMDNGTRTWQETLTEILLYLDYGVMPFEIIWEFRENGFIGVRKLASRWPTTIYDWQLPNGDNGITQDTTNGVFKIPMDKLIIFVNQKEGDNWWGISLLRSAYKHWYMKDKFYLIDAISAERQGLGVPIGFVPVGATDEDKDEMEKIVKNLRVNEKGFAVAEEGFRIEFLDMKAGTTKNLVPSIQNHDRAITLNVLAQFLMLGGTAVGSFALSADQSKLFILSLEAVANHIKDNINRYLIKKLVDYNYNDVKEYPTLEVEKIGTVDANSLTTSLQRAYQTGFLTPQPADEAYVRDAMDLPDFTGETPVDPTLADGLISELDTAMADLTGDPTNDPNTPVEDPNNPGFDMNGDPMPTANTADWTDEQWIKAAEALDVIIASPAGTSPSEETKRKISEALKRSKSSGGKGKKGKGKKAVNPELAAKRKEISALQKQVTAFSTDARRSLLEMKAVGKKMTPEESAKFQLDLFNKMQPIKDKISGLKDQVTAIKDKAATPTPEPKKKASESLELSETLERVNALIDANEK